MNLVLLSGGSGKRLWPLSNDIRSKQFIQIFKKEDGTYESMVQRVFRQIKAVDEQADITIATSKTQLSAIHNQLGEQVSICVEPCRKDTFPAIALAAAYLKDVKHMAESDAVVVCPVDSYVDEAYFQALKQLSKLAEEGDSNLVLMGITPTYPSEKYGYIIPEDGSKDNAQNVKSPDQKEQGAGSGEMEVSLVREFKEKPNEHTAREYIKAGALWNGGVFAFKLGYLLQKAHEIIEFVDYDDLFDQYESLSGISFDYAVAEQENKISVMRFTGQWKDLGTWNTLTEEMSEPIIGDAITNERCENVSIINELNVPILCMGLKDVIVSASAEGILVSDKEQSSYIKPFVDNIRQQVMFAEKSWGSFHVIDVEDESMTIRVTLNPGHQMNYHSHELRDEVWTVISGQGRTIVDGMEEMVQTGDVITMQAGCKHMIIADTELKLIEVQIGKEITVHDKQKFDMPR